MESEFEPYGEELLENLDKILALEKAEVRPDWKEWAQGALGQAMHVSYMALEICDGVTKAAWNVRSYRRYWKLLTLLTARPSKRQKKSPEQRLDRVRERDTVVA